MASPNYLSSFTLQDYIAEKVTKKSSPPPPSQKDFIRAAKKVLKSPSTLSATAQPFEIGITTSYISVTPLASPSQTILVPVSSTQLTLSILRQYFPLATELHYTSGQQLVTLARSSNYTIIGGRIELSHQAFCIPFLGTEVTYVVTEERDVVIHGEAASIMDEMESLVNNIQTEMKISLTEVEKMKVLVMQVQDRQRKKAKEDSIKMKSSIDNQNGLSVGMSVIDQDGLGGLDDMPAVVNGDAGKEVADNYCAGVGNVNVSYDLKNSSERYLEEISHDSNIAIIGEIVVKDEKQKHVDDYGFSDTETEDNSDDLLNDNVNKKEQSPNADEGLMSLKDIIDEKLSDDSFLKTNVKVDSSKTQQTSFTERGYSPASLKQSRPRCVRRICGSKSALS